MAFRIGQRVKLAAASRVGNQLLGVVVRSEAEHTLVEFDEHRVNWMKNEYLTHAFDYEELGFLDAGLPYERYNPQRVEIYRDKRTGLAVFDKQQYEAWITENGL